GDLTTVVQAHVTDQGPAEWHFNFTQGSCVLARGLAERASLTISADSQVWHDLAEKRIGFLGANMKGSLRPEGDLGILMKLDDAFAGAPDESLLVGSNQTQLSSNEEFPTTTSTPAAVEAPRPAVMDRHGLFDAIQAVNKDPNLSAAERQAAIVEAIRHNFGSGAVAAIKRDDGTLQSTFTSATLSTASGETGSDLRRAIQNAVRDLPPGATREQKLAAVKAALGTMSNAVPFAAMLDANTSRSFKGTRESLAERIIEGLLEGLLEGN
ncbi:MAG TPA: SCP2 sterol-binding domain-containing protein, partial [Chloroflexota bacterium]|nr:SCP2 sterol-binding domain-containing protein [Chloroflexota bacterium]